MGMWEADCRHGPGLLVTLDGIYNQGIFVQNKLSVCIPANGGSQFPALSITSTCTLMDQYTYS